MRIWKELKDKYNSKYFMIWKWHNESRTSFFYSIENKKKQVVAYFTTFKEAEDYVRGLELDLREAKLK